MSLLRQAQGLIPEQTQVWMNVGAGGATIAAFFEKIHGPFATISLVLSSIWLAVQLYTWAEKRWWGKKDGS